MAGKVRAGAAPWTAGWNALINSGHSSLGMTPTPLATVVRGGPGQNFGTMVRDMARSYQLALRWKLTGDTRYADLAVTFLDAWSGTMTTLTGNADRFLAAGIYGYQWANAAEIMRGYPGWSAQGQARFKRLMLDVFYPLCHSFLTDHNGTETTRITNYWANWDLCNVAGMLAIGVLCDRRDVFDEAIAYYKNGRGNGAAAHNVYVVHPGHLGQWQESGRDQGHATLGMALTGALCEMAWNQGEDLYGYLNNRLLSGAEYVAASQLPGPANGYVALPYAPYTNVQGRSTAISEVGRPHLRRCWELIHHHYVNRKGLTAPYVTQIAARVGTEVSELGDSLGLGTLTFTRDPIARGAAPSGLTAHLVAGAVRLSWWGTAYATAYEVQRASSATGPWTTLGTVGESRTFTDRPVAGTWFYRVAALTPSGRLTGEDVRRVLVGFELRLHLPLDEGRGNQARDASGHHAASVLMGGAAWGAGRRGGSALRLDGTNGHLAMPEGLMQDLADFSLSLWVYRQRVVAGNARIFDIGTSDIAYLAMIVNATSLRAVTTGTSYLGGAEQTTAAATGLATGRWTHLALVRSGDTVTLYVDGLASGTNPNVDFAPFQMGRTRQNWLGRSQYPTDPYFDGLLQDVRLYSGALPAAELAKLAAR